MNRQRESGQPERGDDRPSGGQVGDDCQQRRLGRWAAGQDWNTTQAVSKR